MERMKSSISIPGEQPTSDSGKDDETMRCHPHRPQEEKEELQDSGNESEEEPPLIIGDVLEDDHHVLHNYPFDHLQASDAEYAPEDETDALPNQNSDVEFCQIFQYHNVSENEHDADQLLISENRLSVPNQPAINTLTGGSERVRISRISNKRRRRPTGSRSMATVVRQSNEHTTATRHPSPKSRPLAHGNPVTEHYGNYFKASIGQTREQSRSRSPNGLSGNSDSDPGDYVLKHTYDSEDSDE